MRIYVRNVGVLSERFDEIAGQQFLELRCSADQQDAKSMMKNTLLTIRPLHQDEIPLALDWAAAEGWNPGVYDAVPFLAEDPEGFLVGVLDGSPVAIVSAVRYGQSFAFGGFYIVRPDCRGRGFGLQMRLAAMARLTGRNVGLDGVLEQQDNYRRYGFKFAHRNVRYSGQSRGSPVTLPDQINLAPLTSLPFAQLALYDRAFFPERRESFLRAWISQPQTVAMGLIDQGKLRGYGVLRACRQGDKIGPLFADTPELAETLFNALCSTLPAGTAIFLDVPECNAAAVALALRHGMTQAFETARMYSGDAPDISLDRTYGITSYELG